MNIDRCKKLLEFLKTLPVGKFDYSTYWKDDCGTVGCIAGWCRTLYSPNASYNTAYGFSMQYLDLTKEQAEVLFLYNCAFARKEHAISRLQWLVDHGSFEGYPLDGERYDE